MIHFMIDLSYELESTTNSNPHSKAAMLSMKPAFEGVHHELNFMRLLEWFWEAHISQIMQQRSMSFRSYLYLEHPTLTYILYQACYALRMERQSQINKALEGIHTQYEVCVGTCQLVVALLACNILLYSVLPHHDRDNQGHVHMLQDYMTRILCEVP